MKYRYIECDLTTLTGIYKADQLIKQGYKYLMGFNIIIFEIPLTE